ncbi:leucine rich repeat LRR-containing protein [Nitzschia inconspicua]|uniref:Leucine rich repeat LRR-containing protein n=1 Tax=Nitzschia inconspicua TaxID=303405 RepID=A0A9K3LB26_9STRA|nr:leucine rich repeat LRR-containing protein [Nitzschia inconspicua]
MFQRKRPFRGNSKKVKLTSSMDEETILQLIGKIKEETHITTIWFDEVTITPSIAAAMGDLFRSTSRYGRVFDKLSIEFCDGFGTDLIITSALMMDGIKNLFLAMDRPRDDVISRLATILRVNTSLISLWLLVPMTETSATAIADALRENENLETLSLSGSNFDKPEEEDDDEDDRGKTSSELASLDTADFTFFSPMETAAALCEGLRENVGLQTVDLSCCYLEDECLSLLVQSLVGHPSLRSLDISRNSAQSQTMRALADVVGIESTILTNLDVREQTDDNNGPLDISHFSRAMRDNRTIYALKLSHNQLKDDQIIELVNHLQGNEVIQELDLQFNQITETGLNYLTENLSGIKSLEVLLLGGNAFGEEGQDLLEHLQKDDDSICTVHDKGLARRKDKKSSSSKKTTLSPMSPKEKSLEKGLAFKFAGFSGLMGSPKAVKKNSEKS